MIKCWHEDPAKRPDFREIVDVATALLEKMGGAPSAPAGSRCLVSVLCVCDACLLFQPVDGARRYVTYFAFI